ncbi:MAG: acyl-CoA desaturase [Polyangiaceae bacterium]|nr:acyl-CoA desaturase [Polyangiaceae bacterium]
MTGTATTDASEKRINWLGSTPFFLIHLGAFAGVFYFGWSWKGLLLAVALYAVRMFGVTGGYHRYFSHRSFKTSRVMQFLLAFLAQTSAQKGALWWASHHRLHHKNSDQEGDVHSAKLDGLFWSHVGWILSGKYDDTDYDRVRDLAKYPELRFLNKYHLVPPTVFGVSLFLVGGWPALYWGLFVSTVLLWHGTFTINSLTHMWGSRRYKTTDDSRNNLWLAIITSGEGWHNNHHHYQRAANQGWYWWEIDTTYYVLWLMSKLGLVWDLHIVPRRIRDAHGASLASKPTSTEVVIAAPQAQ